MTHRAAIYARQSLDRSGEGLAVSRQVEDCRALIAARGWAEVGLYVDNDVSASGRKPRPEYRRLLGDITAGRVTTLVSWAADRLTRRPVEVEELINLVERHSITLATVSGEVDLSTPYGRAVARIFGAIARQEVEQKGARQARANLQRAQTGAARVTRRPFGYDLDGMTVIEAEAAELRKAAEFVLDGATLTSVVADLNERGVRTSTGVPWQVTTLRRVLLNPRYAGLNAYRGKVVSEARWPALITEDAHKALTARLTDPARRTSPGTAGKYLLSGMVLCGRCGMPMYASPMGPKGGYWMVYRCRTAHLARRLDLVDEVVEGVVIARLSRPDATELLIDQGDDAEELRAAAMALRAQMDELADLFAEGAVTGDGLRKASARIKVKLEDVERRRSVTNGASALTPLVSADDVAAVWVQLPLRRRREVVAALLTATILPAGKGQRFEPAQVSIDWKVTA